MKLDHVAEDAVKDRLRCFSFVSIKGQRPDTYTILLCSNSVFILILRSLTISLPSTQIAPAQPNRTHGQDLNPLSHSPIKHPSPPLQRRNIPINPHTTYHRPHLITQIAMPPKRLSGMHIGNMHLNKRYLNRKQRVSQCHRCMRECSRVDDDAVALGARSVDPVH